MHLVEAAGRKVLLDCGLVRGHRSHPRPHDGHFPFAAATLDAVVLSHAHIDHCGNLPNLVRHGFTGPIYCTPATRDLLALMLANSARLQEEDAVVLGVIGHPAASEPLPLFTQHDVDQTLRQCRAVPYNQTWEIGPDVQARLVDAGHILGSAMVALTIAWQGRTGQLTFTGDLGRRGTPLLRNPAPVPAADLLISESTYGARALEAPARAVEALEALVRQTVERGGKVLIPAFSLGRTQVVAHVLEQAIRAGRVPEVPVFIDSPLAANIADVYQRHADCLDEDKAGPTGSAKLLDLRPVRYVRSPEESKDLSTQRHPCVIVAPSGMCEGGRIVGHLKHNVDDPRCSVILVTYQAPHTPGRQLLQRGPTVRLHGRAWNKWADVVYLAGFSGHADRGDLLAFLGPLAERKPKVRLVHGEADQAEALASGLREQGFQDVGIPSPGETVPLF
jgi:metallo-beta-lactamase family protein